MSDLNEDAEPHYVTVVRTQVVEMIMRANDAKDAVERALASETLAESKDWATANIFVDKVLIIDGQGDFVQLQVEED